MNKSAASGKPKPNIPQVKVATEKKLPKKTRRKKQAVKQKSTNSEKSEAVTEKGSKVKNSPIAGIKLDSEFDYPEYLIDMRNRIQENWRPPTLNTSIATRIYFNIAKDGTLLRAYVEKKTGIISFDMSAMNAVTESAPFSPLPEDFPEKELGVHFEFIYEQ